MQIDQADPADVDALVDLLNTAYRSGNGWTSEAGLITGSRVQPAHIHAWQKSPSQALWVGRLNQIVVGCVVTEAHAGDGHIGSLAVHPDHQGKGIGNCLLRHAEAALADQGVTRLRLSVVTGRPELVAYYSRRGYQTLNSFSDFPHAAGVGTPVVANLQLEHFAKSLTP